MRLIDADALLKEFSVRAVRARNWKEAALNSGNEESAIRADATLAFLAEVKLTVENAPTYELMMARGVNGVPFVVEVKNDRNEQTVTKSDELIQGIREVQQILMSNVDCFASNYYVTVNKANTKLEQIARLLKEKKE